jgi:hypothetical protein
MRIIGVRVAIRSGGGLAQECGAFFLNAESGEYSSKRSRTGSTQHTIVGDRLWELLAR